MEEKILQEVKEKRERYVKHFRMQQKGMVAAVYPNAIHYQENGQWKEIDNRLEPITANGKTVYKNRASAMKVTFSGEADEEPFVVIEKDGMKVMWGLQSEQQNSPTTAQDTAELATESENTRQRVPFKKCSFQVLEKSEVKKCQETAEKKLISSENLDTERNENYQMLSVANLTSEGMYEDILPGIDLHYAIQSEFVKENIRIRTREAAEKRLTFTFCHPGLEMHMEQDGSLGLYKITDPDEIGNTIKEPVFRFAKPYMYDYAGNCSHNVKFLNETNGEESCVTIVPDKEWLLDRQRVYPIVIDPMTETAKTRANIEDTYIFTGSGENPADVYAYGSVVVGQSSTLGKVRALLRFKNLPDIGKGSIIYGATMYLWQYAYSTYSTPTIPLMAYEVTENWDEKSVRWSNQPSVDNNVLDYKMVGKVQNGNVINITPIGFDVTRLVRQWYNTGKNYGIMVRSQYEDTTENSKKAYARFHASDAPDISSEQFPSGVFYYRNVNGREEYQSYHEQDMGRAGIGYTNDFTGNVVWIHSDAGTIGGPMQTEICHVYNSSETGVSSRFGYGWRLSCMQELRESGIADYPYVYIDEDGTKHYFYKDTGDGNKLKDEDGLGLTITMTSSSNYDRYRCIETKDKRKYIFGQDGYLRFIEDLDGNAIWHQYSPNTAGNYIGFVQDPTGERLTATFANDTTKSRLMSITDAAGRAVRYSYDSQGNLTAITYPDGKQTNFTYDSAHKLLSVKNPEGKRIKYEYANDFRVPRVSRISEYGDDSALGQEIKISYQNGNTSIFEEPGLDGEISQTVDNKKTTYNFDNMGRPTDILNSDGFANKFEYYTSGMKNHKLGKEGAVQKTVYNLLKNPVLDPAHKNSGWYILKEDGTRNSTLSIAEGYQGTKSTKLINNGGEYGERLGQEVALKKGVYTFSAYMKTENMRTLQNGVTFSTDSGAGLRIRIGNKEVIGKGNIPYTTDPNVDGGWERRTLTFQIEADSTVEVYAGIFKMAGTVYVSGVQLEAGKAANKLNLVDNPGFEWCTDGKPDNWNYHAQATGNKTLIDPEKGRCAVLNGQMDAQLTCAQAVNVTGKENEIYNLSCWVKGVGIPGKQFSVSAAVIYTDNSVKWHDFMCNPNISGWQFVSGIFSTDDEDENTNKTYRAIHVYLMHYNQTNQVLYKGVQLVRDDGTSYQYDDDGNLISAVSAAESSQFASNKKGSLTRLGNIDGTAFEYGYDAKNRLIRAVNSEGIRYKFGYDEKGLPVKMIVEGGKHFSAVTPGRIYYIREKYSGNYLDVQNGNVQDGTTVQLYQFNGSTAQKWKVLEGGKGYFIFEPQNAVGKRLDLNANSNTDGAKIDIYSANNTDAQKWKLHPCRDGGYQISCKGTDDKRGLTNGPKNTEAGQAVQNYSLSEENINQCWYFEPADEGNISAAPVAGGVYHIRARHSGQYINIENFGVTEGTRAVQAYYGGQRNQQFRLKSASDGYFYLEPLHTQGMAIAKHGTHSATGCSTLALEEKKEGAANQMFRFEEAEPGKGTGYALICKDGNVSLDVAYYSYDNGADIILTAHYAANQVNKWWILEECGERMESAMTYTSDRRNVESVTDARGNTVRYEYDEKNRLLTKETDAKGNPTFYGYDADTDRLLEVKRQMTGKNVAVRYVYENDRLKGIAHNGFKYTYDYDNYGNLKSVSIGDVELEHNSFRNKNGLADQTKYATGESVRNVYDAEERLESQYLVKKDRTEEKLFTNTYDNYGNLVIREDHRNSITSNYQYDLIGRIVGADTTDGMTLRTAYDDKNRVKEVTQKIKDVLMSTEYIHGDTASQEKPGLLYGVKVDGTKRISYEYDRLARLRKRTLHLENGRENAVTYEYVPGAAEGTTTLLVSAMKSGNQNLVYTYDKLGNISTISEDGILKCSYHYDELSRLVREDNVWENKTICYEYDDGGNMTSRKFYAYHQLGTQITEADMPMKTDTFGYGNTGWKDQLTAYNGQEITYDAMGNPLFYRGMKFTWEKGSELKQTAKDGRTISYAYDNEGNRIGKTVDGVKTRYYLNGSRIIALTSGNDQIQFAYDEKETPVFMRMNGQIYYYLYNIQNDVIGLLDSAGTQVVSYRYNSWGKLMTVTDITVDKVGSKNPFRYRRYSWDEETGLYYAGSRYYDPETARFVNADDVDVLSVEQGNLNQYNLYAYCLNNPINRLDEDGNFSLPNWAKVTAGAVATVTAVGLTVATGGAVLPILTSVAISTLSGAAIGYVTDGKEGAINGAADGFMWGGIGTLATSAIGAVKTVKTYKKTIDTYSVLKKQYKGTSKEVHHIVEKRLAKPYEVNTRRMPSIALDKATHRIYTNEWRKQISYGSGKARKWKIYKASRRVYKNSRVLRYASIVSLRLFKK